jgi:hypothetical protein
MAAPVVSASHSAMLFICVTSCLSNSAGLPGTGLGRRTPLSCCLPVGGVPISDYACHQGWCFLKLNSRVQERAKGGRQGASNGLIDSQSAAGDKCCCNSVEVKRSCAAVPVGTGRWATGDSLEGGGPVNRGGRQMAESC